MRHVIERLVVTAGDEDVRSEHLPADLQLASPTDSSAIGTLAEGAEGAEKQAIQTALSACNCHREQTSKLLGVSVRTLHYKMKRYGLH